MKKWVIKNIFADKSTLVFRKMLREPEKKWIVRGFIGLEGVSLGMAQGILDAMEKYGYIERTKKGCKSYTVLTNPNKLISDWVKKYEFNQNEVYTYYSPDKYILEKVRDFLKEYQYVLTLHAGSNLITSFVRTEDIYIYLNTRNWERDIINIRQKLDLKELVKGGNFHIIKPVYKNSVFFNIQKIKRYPVVSNLQLYLDLYNFQPRGKEHAECLKELLEKKGKTLD